MADALDRTVTGPGGLLGFGEFQLFLEVPEDLGLIFFRQKIVDDQTSRIVIVQQCRTVNVLIRVNENSHYESTALLYARSDYAFALAIFAYQIYPNVHFELRCAADGGFAWG